MSTRISVIVPSRGRPKILTRMVSSVFEKALSKGNVEVVLLLDKDDQESLQLSFEEYQVVRLVGDQMSMGARIIKCVEAASGEILVITNDDVIVQTKGWDELICSTSGSFADGIYLLYPDDGFKNKKLATFPVFSKHAVSLGLLDGLNEFQGSFIDLHLLEIFQRIKHRGHNRIRYLEKILFEHMHYRLGKGAWDSTYARRDRFQDGPVFSSLNGARKLMAGNFWKKIKGKTDLNPLPLKSKSKSWIVYIFDLILDNGLPLNIRIWRGFWFLCHQKIGPFIISLAALIKIRPK